MHDHRDFRTAVRRFVEDEIAPHAKRMDAEQRLCAEVVVALVQSGYLGALIPRELGGSGLDVLRYGALQEEIGRHCAATRGLLTVQSMVATALLAWGTREQREEMLPAMAAGAMVASFALTEPAAGSDASAITTSAARCASGFVIDGRKRWVSLGQIADLYLVVARTAEGPSAFLVPRGTPGLEVEPIGGLLGYRGGMLAELRLTRCPVPARALLGRLGGGLAQVVAVALDIGRYGVAWGSVGLAQACFEASVRHVATRRAGRGVIGDYQLVQGMVADMATEVGAARLLCERAGERRRAGDPRAMSDTLLAKYFASRVASRVARDAVQLHGAAGLSDELPIERHFRDAKVGEIVEGSTQIHQVLIARLAAQEVQPSVAASRTALHDGATGAMP